MKHSFMPATSVWKPMKRSLIFLSVMALTMAVCASCGTKNGEDKSDRFKQEGLKGDVAAIEVRTYEAKTEFGESTPGTLKSRYTKTFDEQGMLLLKVEYYNTTDSTVYQYVYNDGKLDTMKIGQSNDYVVYTYYPNGELKTQAKYNKEGLSFQSVYTLNEEGKIGEERIIDGEGNLQKRFVMTYENNVRHTRSYNQINEFVDYYDKTYPDSTIYEVYEKENGKQKLIYKTVHNNRNELVMKNDYLISLMSNDVPESTSYRYERDEKGNWTTCTLIDNTRELAIEIQKRTISYR